MRRPFPIRIQNAPDLFMGLELFYGAFCDLTTCRGGMGDGPIPWTAIKEWINEHELEGEQREDVFYHVMKMDDAARKFWTEKRERDKG